MNRLSPKIQAKALLIKTEEIENVVVDEVNDRTYVVMAARFLTDGELYKIIRLELLRRGCSLARGERIVISATKGTPIGHAKAGKPPPVE